MFNFKHFSRLNKGFVFIITLLIVFTFTFDSSAASVAVTKDKESKYKPTKIINGNFQVPPWMEFTLSGVKYSDYKIRNTIPDKFATISTSDIKFNSINGGWNSTEYQLNAGNLFEWIDGLGHLIAGAGMDWTRSWGNGQDMDDGWTYVPDGSPLLKEGNYFIEMNSQHAATVFQDLYTNPGNIIKWSLKHGFRTTSSPSLQEMVIQIGAPIRAADSSIIYPEGTGIAVNVNIEDESKAIYSSSGVSNGSLNLGYAKNSELANLDLNTPSENKWYSAKGVYIIPDGQDVTRFSFISANGDNKGNLLDDIVFNTLLGNLKAGHTSDGSILVTGYWGELDDDKSLVLEVLGKKFTVNMSSINNSNFKLIIPRPLLPAEAKEVTIYHEDYSEVNKTLSIDELVTDDWADSISAALATSDDNNPAVYLGLILIALISLIILGGKLNAGLRR